jgi:hypothetical protein
VFTTPSPLKTSYSALNGLVNHGDVIHEFRRHALQGAPVSLPMSLGALILLDVIDQHLQPAVDCTMIQAESEAPDLERFAAALMLPALYRRRALLRWKAGSTGAAV